MACCLSPLDGGIYQRISDFKQGFVFYAFISFLGNFMALEEEEEEIHQEMFSTREEEKWKSCFLENVDFQLLGWTQKEIKATEQSWL